MKKPVEGSMLHGHTMMMAVMVVMKVLDQVLHLLRRYFILHFQLSNNALYFHQDLQGHYLNKQPWMIYSMKKGASLEQYR